MGVVFEAEREFLLLYLKYTVIYRHYIAWFDYSFVHDNIGHYLLPHQRETWILKTLEWESCVESARENTVCIITTECISFLLSAALLLFLARRPSVKQVLQV